MELEPETELLRQQLATGIARYTREDGNFPTAIPGLSLYRHSQVDPPICVIYEPALIVVAQGLKQIVVGEDTYTYGPTEFLMTSIEIPAVYRSLEACPDRPDLCLILKFDPLEISELLTQIVAEERRLPEGRGLGLLKVSAPILQAISRLVDLLQTPEDIPILGGLIRREIVYRLLVSEGGACLRQLARADSQFSLITRAINWLRSHYAEPLRIENLAELASMSTSSLHHQFKSITGLSPGQYQKQIRLSEARRLMLAGGEDAASVGQAVGYQSPSHFSRDYRRFYGLPPLQDIRQLREYLHLSG